MRELKNWSQTNKNKTVMKPFLLLILMICSVSGLLAQQVKYVYNDAGNRTQRKVITLPKSSPEERGEEKGMSKSTVTDPDQPSETLASVLERYDDLLGERKIVIYPNPTQGFLRIEYQGGGELKNARLLLYDMQGKLLRQMNRVASPQMLDLSPYPAGVYILQIIEGAAKSEWKIVKE